VTRRPTPHDPPTHPRADAWELIGGHYVPPGCARPSSGGVGAAAAPGGIPASLLVYPGPGTPAAGGDATTSTDRSTP
jgi:hypothetical protein